MIALTARQKAALKSGAAVATLVHLSHPEGDVRAWSGTGVLEAAGHEWVGAGLVAAISGVEQTSAPEVSEVTLSLTGVPADVLSVAAVSLKGQVAEIFEAVLGPDGRVVDGLIPLDLVDMDRQEVSAGADGTYTISCIGQSGFWQLQLAANTAWSPEDQKAVHPDDTGMDYMARLISAEITWTRT